MDAELNQAVAQRRATLMQKLAIFSAGGVHSGPFAGSLVAWEGAAVSPCLSPILLGCFEEELHPHIEAAIQRTPQSVVNIGAAEGYYAAGLALRLPEAVIIAFEMDQGAQERCRQAAARNGVADRIDLRGKCDVTALSNCLPEQALVFCDCEGAELGILDPASVPALRSAFIIVECHDFADRSITGTLRNRFTPTHTVDMATEGPRDPNRFPFLRRLDSLDRWLAVCEDRPETMHWLICTPNA